MTLRPIPGAPAEAPIPDFPTGEPAAMVAPAPRVASGPVEAAPLPEVRRPGPVEIRGADGDILVFRCFPEIPAITRSSMTISVMSGPPRGEANRAMPRFDLATDDAKAFLLALRDGALPIVIADAAAGFQLECAVAEDRLVYTILHPGRGGTRHRFAVEQGDDVTAMVVHLLAELGP